MIFPPFARRTAAVVFGVVVNAALVLSLARLDAPAEDEDAHQAHRVRPSVVEPPPPPPPAPDDRAQSPAPPAPLLDPPAPPPLELPPAPDLAAGASLGDLDGLGRLGGIEFGSGLAGASPPPPRSGPVDVGPRLAAPPDLARFYPRLARRRGVEGRTLVAVEVGPDGRARGARVLRSDPPGVFDEAALQAARSLTFTPAERAGAPVTAETRLELEWRTRN